MNVFNISLPILLLSLGTALHAVEPPSRGFYLAGSGSMDFASNRYNDGQKLKNGSGGAVEVGYITGQSFRVEAELGFKSHKNERYFAPNILVTPGYLGEDGGKAERWFAMANGFYDFRLHHRLDYYVGGGLGVMRFSGRVSALYPQRNDYEGITKFAAQFLTGVTWSFSPRLAGTLGYRLAGAERASFRGYQVNSRAFHSLEVGLRVRL